jgi:hypothetical protein
MLLNRVLIELWHLKHSLRHKQLVSRWTQLFIRRISTPLNAL